MKQSLLIVFLVIISAPAGFSQCTPDPQYENEDFGVWPDTAQGFPDGQVGEYYEQVINIKVPEDGSAVDSSFAGFSVDSISLDEIVNLPPGLELVCNSQTNGACTYLAGELGCALVQGTPTQAGVYDVAISAFAHGNIAGIPINNNPITFDNYSITIDEAAGLEGVEKNAFQVYPNIPNPASSQTVLYYNLPKPSRVSVTIFDFVGKRVYHKETRGELGKNSVQLNVGSLESGVYLYTIESMGIKETRRLAVER